MCKHRQRNSQLTCVDSNRGNSCHEELCAIWVFMAKLFELYSTYALWNGRGEYLEFVENLIMVVSEKNFFWRTRGLSRSSWFLLENRWHVAFLPLLCSLLEWYLAAFKCSFMSRLRGTKNFWLRWTDLLNTFDNWVNTTSRGSVSWSCDSKNIFNSKINSVQCIMMWKWFLVRSSALSLL